ncbi:MAG: sulfite exporter TauE/SafE family protein [Deltaproteobacteria bacterium]|nr:sulfite exporter TauE/SafE family protein [Deltaproteobacteria bacterium]
MEELLGNVQVYVNDSPWFAVVVVFLGGLITASNPCVLAMIPLMMSFVAGREEEGASIARSFGYSMVFVLGLGITFTAMGMVAALAGSMYGEVSSVWNWVVAGVCLLMGLHLMGLIPLNIPALVRFQPRTRGLLGALILGLFFGLVSAPCAGPILVVLLTYLAGSGASVLYGGALLLVYALGHSVLILVAGTSMGAAKKLIENKKATKALAWLRRGAGVAVVLVGVFFVYQALA